MAAGWKPAVWQESRLDDAETENVNVDREETGPLRTCVATRTVRPLDEMLRFVVGPDGSVVPDLKRKLPGRGVWVTATRSAVADAVRRKAIGRGFRGKGAPPEVRQRLDEEIDGLMEHAALQALSLANKAGVVVAGAAKVEAAIAAGAVGALLHASDGSADGARKLGQAVRRRFGERDVEISRVDLFDSAQISLALGRANVIHAALATGGACQAFLAQCRRLALYRTGAPTSARANEDGKDTAQEAEPRPVGGEAMNGRSPGI